MDDSFKIMAIQTGSGMKKERIRAAAIVIHEGSLLLMHRKKNGKEYYVIPGGGVEEHESIEHAALRELAEETSIQATLMRLVYTLHGKRDQCDSHEYFYLCDYKAGFPMLMNDSIESERMQSGEQWYEPLWVSCALLTTLNLLPPTIKEWLVEDLQKGFDTNVKVSKEVQEL